jgi:hypothetical protein
MCEKFPLSFSIHNISRFICYSGSKLGAKYTFFLGLFLWGMGYVLSYIMWFQISTFNSTTHGHVSNIHVV